MEIAVADQASLFGELFSRIGQDPIIRWFLIAQAILWLLLFYLCRWHLIRARRLANRLVRDAEGGQGPSALRKRAVGWGELTEALEKVAGHSRQGELPYGVTDELSSDALLPAGYNHRLDVAAPGVFTAVGILGTFLGLIVAFLHTNTQDAGRSIDPLMRGMTVAFVNSIVGVGSAVAWTLWSRISRHSYDIACEKLSSHLMRTFSLKPAKAVRAAEMQQLTAYIQQLGRDFTREVAALTESSSRSSRELLDQLAPKLQESLQGLVTAPFETLAHTVQRFDEATHTAALKQVELLEQIQEASRTLSSATDDLGRSAGLVHAQVEEFRTATAALSEHTGAARELVGETRSAGRELMEVGAGLASGTALLGDLLQNLAATRDALVESSDALTTGADAFREATGRLDSTIGNLSMAAGAAVTDSMVTVRQDLEAAATEIARSMARTGEATVTAYREASTKVTDAIDEQMSDLADRLRAQLDTLAAQVPTTMSHMEEITADSRKAITGAIRSLESASRTLNERSNEMLREHLSAYDGAIREAVERFSGTLAMWEDRMEALEGVTRSFGQLVERSSNGHTR